MQRHARRWRLHTQLLAQPRDADLEELVQIAADDAQEAQPLEQRDRRILRQRERLTAADVVIVVAGMDGALPSVVGGLVDCPVIACPTSIGYGAAFGGVAALLTMLNSCSAGVCVVNIDAGFKAGYVAARFVKRMR